MPIFSKLDDKERTFIVSLPYKVGVWISHADDERGEADDIKETGALERCLQALLKSEDDPFLAMTITDTIAAKEQWPQWSEYIFRIPEEVQQALNLIVQHESMSAARSYANALLKIANAVAEAHGEFSSFDDPEDEEDGFSAFFGKIISGFSGVNEMEDHHPMNISASEKQAIDQLRAVVKDVIHTS